LCYYELQQPGSEVSFPHQTHSSVSFQRQHQQVSAFLPAANLNNAAGKSALRAAEKPHVPGPPYSGPASKPILDSVKYPSDMKKLSLAQINQVRYKMCYTTFDAMTK
jgi:hypothetical protein